MRYNVPIRILEKMAKLFAGISENFSKNIKVFKPALLLANVCLAQQEIYSP